MLSNYETEWQSDAHTTKEHLHSDSLGDPSKAVVFAPQISFGNDQYITVFVQYRDWQARIEDGSIPVKGQQARLFETS